MMLGTKSLRIALLVLATHLMSLAGVASAEERAVRGAYVEAAFAIGFEQFRNVDELESGGYLDVKSIDDAFGINFPGSEGAGGADGPRPCRSAQLAVGNDSIGGREGRLFG
jgi:hypothetical protein